MAELDITSRKEHRQMTRVPPKRMPPRHYQKIVDELEHVAAMVRERPELNHEAAARLIEIAQQIRKDAGLPERSAKGS